MKKGPAGVGDLQQDPRLDPRAWTTASIFVIEGKSSYRGTSIITDPEHHLGRLRAFEFKFIEADQSGAISTQSLPTGINHPTNSAKVGLMSRNFPNTCTVSGEKEGGA